jgi:hypothetical protein
LQTSMVYASYVFFAEGDQNKIASKALLKLKTLLHNSILLLQV